MQSTMYGFDVETGKRHGLRLSGNALLVQDVGWIILGKARYTIDSGAVAHTLTNGTKQILLTTNLDSEESTRIYIDFDAETPSASEAPVILKDAIVLLPVAEVHTVNIMCDISAEVGILELG